MKTLLKKVLGVAFSGKATLVLLGVLLVVFFAGRAMPWMYTSPFTFALLAAFFINIVGAMISRVPGVAKKCRAAEPSDVTTQMSPYVDIPATGSADEVFKEVKEALPRYSLVAKDNTFSATRFGYGPLGTLVLYAAVLMLLAGGLVVFYTRTQGEVVLTEGQFFTGGPMEYIRFRPPIIGSPPALGFIVNKIKPSKAWEPSGFETELLVEAPGGSEPRKLYGKGRAKAGDAQVRITEAGVSPNVILRGPDGFVYEDAFVNLLVLYGWEDTFRFSATPYVARFNFYPDYYKGKFGDATRSLKMNNPVFRVRIYRADSLIQDELMKPGDKMNINGLSFGIGDIRLWGKFIITKQKGTPVLKAGIVVGLIGLVWLCLFHRRLIRGRLRDGKLLLTGQSDHFSGLNKRRIKKLAERLRH